MRQRGDGHRLSSLLTTPMKVGIPIGIGGFVGLTWSSIEGPDVTAIPSSAVALSLLVVWYHTVRCWRHVWCGSEHLVVRAGRQTIEIPYGAVYSIDRVGVGGWMVVYLRERGSLGQEIAFLPDCINGYRWTKELVERRRVRADRMPLP